MNDFFDRRLLLNGYITLAGSILMVIIIKVTPSIHLPFLAAAALSAGLGFIEPRRGWFLAILQASFIWLGYELFTNPPRISSDIEIETFSLYGAMLLTFAGSFIGGMLKRALDKPGSR
ncbi:hypothetical protein GCM10023189_47750 [Nibrella saemangeumensis]|uniref:Transmembrane family 220, helix n=1 Tax=Nibrella saemangeumensis TaxID=1084526 RepID=A0ABP8NHW8_9BACT